MDSYWDAVYNSVAMNVEGRPTELELSWLLQVDRPMVLMGKFYEGSRGAISLLHDLQALPWFTYRQGFSPIGRADGPTTDQGWGCMHRTGQMMLALSLFRIHLGRHWHLLDNKNDLLFEKYRRIVELFYDTKSAHYSIHQLALMGSMEDENFAKWLGPNAVAQTIKKLAASDKWSNMVVHIALEEGVVIDEIRLKCSAPQDHGGSDIAEKSWVVVDNGINPLCDLSNHTVSNRDGDYTRSKVVEDQFLSGVQRPGIPPTTSNHEGRNSSISFSSLYPQQDVVSSGCCSTKDDWQCSLLLIIPLRLGLVNCDPMYFDVLKRCFECPYSVGIMGGWPRHALWMVGYNGDQILYLDPHFTQHALTEQSCLRDTSHADAQHVFRDTPDGRDRENGSKLPKTGYSVQDCVDKHSPVKLGEAISNTAHAVGSAIYQKAYMSLQHLSVMANSSPNVNGDAVFNPVIPSVLARQTFRMPFTQLDPSMAVCFLCTTEVEFEHMLDELRTKIYPSSARPPFEIHETRLPMQYDLPDGSNYVHWCSTDSDDEFEVL